MTGERGPVHKTAEKCAKSTIFVWQFSTENPWPKRRFESRTVTVLIAVPGQNYQHAMTEMDNRWTTSQLSRVSHSRHDSWTIENITTKNVLSPLPVVLPPAQNFLNLTDDLHFVRGCQ